MSDKELQKSFIHHFLWTAYANMAMEDEVSEKFDEEKLYQRYKPMLDSLISEGIYKKIKRKDERYNKANF